MGTAQSLSTPMIARETSSRWSEAEFRSIFLEHYSRIVGVLVRLLGERTRAEELANDALWRLYCQPRSPEMNGNVAGWLYRTATNLGVDALRASIRRSRYENAAAKLSLETSAPGPLEEVLRQEKCRKVRAVLASIKPGQAQLLILRASGFSYNELAQALQVKPGGIGTTLSRAETVFRDRYLEMHGHEEEL